MRARLIFATLGFAAIVACGGGGGGGSPITPSTATPTPANTDERPATSGDTFSYAGTTTTAFVRPPQINGAIPSPNPANTETLSYATTQSQSVTSGRTFNGVTNAVEFTTAESDTLAGGLSTTTSTASEYYSFAANGASQIVRDLGGTQTTSAGEIVSTTIGPNNGLIDVLPETAGPIGPANDAQLTRSENDADGTTSQRATASNGTYTEDDAFADGTTATAIANGDGSGTYSFPLGEQTNALFAVAAPAGSGASAAIAITITYPAGLIVTPDASPTPTVVNRTVGVWYPTPLVLSTQTLVDRGASAVPAACNVAAAYGSTTARSIVASASTVDPVFGELDSRSTTTYAAPGIGVACVQFLDTLQQFYDFSEQTGQIVATRSTPVQTTTTTQTLGLTSENVIGMSSIARARFVAASRARFDAMLATRRAQRRTRALHALRASHPASQGVR